MPCFSSAALVARNPAERADPEHGVRVGVAGRVRVQTLARRLVGHRCCELPGTASYSA